MKQYLQITVSEVDDKGIQTVTFEGAFDKVGHADIREELDTIIDSFKGKCLVFDFKVLTFINSEGIGYLMEAFSFLSGRSQSLVIIGPNAHVADVFDAIGLNDVIKVYPTMKAFTETLA